MQKFVDIYIVYQLVKRLATPFEKTAAFKLGIIDKRGTVLRPIKSLKTAEEKNAWTWLDILLNNLKRALVHLPGGKSRFFAYAASLYMLKEPLKELRNISHLTGGALLEHIYSPNTDNYLMEAAEIIHEDAMMTGSGQVAGIGTGPDGAGSVHRKGQFAGCEVFEVDSDTFHKCRFGKKKYHRYERYVGTGPVGEDIKNYGKANRKKGIILMDRMTRSMFYLRRPRK
jgi:hypothetical protein